LPRELPVPSHLFLEALTTAFNKITKVETRGEIRRRRGESARSFRASLKNAKLINKVSLIERRR